MKSILSIVVFIGLTFTTHSQNTQDKEILAKIRTEGFLNSQAMNMLEELSDVYGQRLTGSREYYAAANWISNKMKASGLQNVHFENYCDNCRGWSMKTFNVEMTAPNFMHINAYPLSMAKSTNGIVEGEVVHIKSFKNMAALRKQYSGKLKGKVILFGAEPKRKKLTGDVLKRYSKEELKTMEDKLIPKNKQTNSIT
jgi:hypothetical protein